MGRRWSGWCLWCGRAWTSCVPSGSRRASWRPPGIWRGLASCCSQQRWRSRWGQISEASVTRLLARHRSRSVRLPRHGPERANSVTKGCAHGADCLGHAGAGALRGGSGASRGGRAVPGSTLGPCTRLWPVWPTGWSERVALLSRGQAAMGQAIQTAFACLPFSVVELQDQADGLTADRQVLRRTGQNNRAASPHQTCCTAKPGNEKGSVGKAEAPHKHTNKKVKPNSLSSGLCIRIRIATPARKVRMSHIFVQFLLYEVVVNIFANAGLRGFPPLVGDDLSTYSPPTPFLYYLSSTTSEVACQSGSTRFHPSHRGCRCVGGSETSARRWAATVNDGMDRIDIAALPISSGEAASPSRAMPAPSSATWAARSG